MLNSPADAARGGLGRILRPCRVAGLAALIGAPRAASQPGALQLDRCLPASRLCPFWCCRESVSETVHSPRVSQSPALPLAKTTIFSLKSST
ncbi:hypothetical protein PF005_g6872 [Phytophthora fragariae]|uniref:Uncharacterized protein n=1 Tax=Phytophthora fragariae TaxID=53985 RepID=A0A6A4E855_9STRA|nr:hypothetical protein PF003_g18218 [Phytophthora fragariae]KAE8942069.1 hypothetical protein PF009_g8160 [Phytophthora fragariae]KAE9025900.1 hypothetical protein PF011_g2820 [Phytophthora fragariae]KAE9116353.1 hypothetical protein PF010_g8990 [Phytophthora fragariae]KAE9119188.1 hypothetical protein PF007_g8640 [Phytophthora fragariae]